MRDIPKMLSRLQGAQSYPLMDGGEEFVSKHGPIFFYRPNGDLYKIVNQVTREVIATF
ncbi:MAG: hypothetical protein ABGX83_05510 [Nitrospira sp.]